MRGERGFTRSTRSVRRAWNVSEVGMKGLFQREHNKTQQLSLVQWKEHFFLGMVKDNNNRLITALLKQIESHRNGEQVDGGMIKSIVDSMGACLDLAVFDKKRGIKETHAATCFFGSDYSQPGFRGRTASRRQGQQDAHRSLPGTLPKAVLDGHRKLLQGRV
jgi:hypothetical protein